MTMGLGAYYLRKAVELGDAELLKEVLSPFLSEKPVKPTKIKPTEVISAEDLSAILLHPVPGDLLYKAAKNDNPEMLEVFMKGINQAFSSDFRHRVCFSAVSSLNHENDIKNIKRFCENGYEPNFFDLGNVLSYSYNPDALQVYIDNGAVEKSNPVDLACTWMTGVTRHNVPQEERTKILNDLMAHGMDIKNNYILFHVLNASADWSKEPFKDLIKAGAPIEQDSEIPSLHLALDRSNTDAAEILIQGASKEALKNPDFYGATLLMKAASEYYPRSVKLIDMLLEKGADMNAVDKQGRNVLMYVNDQRTAEALIQRGANASHKDNGGLSVAEYLEAKASFSRNRMNVLRAATYIRECAQDQQPKMAAVSQKQGGRD